MRRALPFALPFAFASLALVARPPKPAESEAQARVVTALLKALPPPPEGWVDTTKDASHELGSVASNQEAYVLRFYVYCLWKNPAAIARAEQARREAILAEPARAQPDTMAMEALFKERNALVQRMGEALQRNDQAGYQRIVAQLDELDRTKGESLKKAAAEHMRDRLRPSALHDGELAIQFSVNESGLGLGTVTREPAPAEGIQAFREDGRENDQGDWIEGTTLAFVGAWKPSGNSMAAPLSLKAGYLKPQTLMVSFTGDRERVRQVMKGVDWKALRALIGR